MTGADLAGTDEPEEGLEDDIIVWGLWFMCETKGGEMYFVQSFKFYAAHCPM